MYDEDEGAEDDAAALETLSNLLSQASPDGTLPSSGANTQSVVGGQNGPATVPLEARVAAISAEIAAAIAQAQLQVQMMDEDDEDDEGESDEDYGNAVADGQDSAGVSGIVHGMNVSGIRTEQPEPRPEDGPPSPVSASAAERASVAPGSLPSTENHRPEAAEVDTDTEEVDEDDFPVPLRERKSKASTPVSVAAAGG